jgi:hypothetical protein
VVVDGDADFSRDLRFVETRGTMQGDAGLETGAWHAYGRAAVHNGSSRNAGFALR